MDKLKKPTRMDLLKELIWSFIVSLVTFVYIMLFLLIISFVFQSMLDLKLITMLYVAIAGSIIMFVYRIIRTILRPSSN